MRVEQCKEEDRVMNTNRTVAGIRWWILVGTLALLLAELPPGAVSQRDRGVNQPGAAGNRGGRDPGVNQPGALGNYGGSVRQTRVRDPGLNQPGMVGNRRP